MSIGAPGEGSARVKQKYGAQRTNLRELAHRLEAARHIAVLELVNQDCNLVQLIALGRCEEGVAARLRGGERAMHVSDRPLARRR